MPCVRKEGDGDAVSFTNFFHFCLNSIWFILDPV